MSDFDILFSEKPAVKRSTKPPNTKKTDLSMSSNSSFSELNKSDPLLFSEDLLNSAPPSSPSSSSSLFSEIDVSPDLLNSSPLGDNEENKNVKERKIGNKNIPLNNSEKISMLLKEHPYIASYVMITHPQNFTISQEKFREKIKNSVAVSVCSLAGISDIIKANSQKLKQKRISVEEKKRKINQRKDISNSIKVAMTINFNLKLNMISLNEEHLDRLNDSLLHVLSYINLLQSENPDDDVKINVDFIMKEIDSFPNCCKKANMIFCRRKYVKMHIKRLEKKEALSVKEDMLNVIRNCEKIMKIQLKYFIDTGEIENDFERVINRMSNNIIMNSERRLIETVEKPEKTGKLIIDQCNEIIKILSLDQKRCLPTFFILVSRLFFSQIYLRSLIYSYKKNYLLSSSSSSQQNKSNTVYSKLISNDNNNNDNSNNNIEGSNNINNSNCKIGFPERLDILRKFTPIGFGFSQKFLPSTLFSVPLKSFPIDNPYSKAVALFSSLRFIICPIDFCYTVHLALKEIQDVASNISRQKKQKETGQIVAKYDHLLCLDDLFDISLIVFLLSTPFDLCAITKSIEAYVEGLQLISELEFAFTNVNAMVSHIETLDITNFVLEAKKRTAEAQEMDPLEIGI